MICPNCRCEYREGFQYCSDCNIELVEALQPIVEYNKKRLLRRSKIKITTQYYLLNGMLGFVGSPLFVYVASLVGPKPPRYSQYHNNILLLFLIIVIAINIIAIISFVRKNKVEGSYSFKLLKFMLLNFTIFLLTFIAFLFIHSLFLRLRQ